MSALTIEELKTILNENGVDIPVGRLKKEDYVKLYEDNILPGHANSTEFSDSENTESSIKVTSTNQLVEETVHALSNDELFEKLKSLGYNPGPVMPNTRRVYEKKLLKMLQMDGAVTNGNGNSQELSDSEELSVSMPARRSVSPAQRRSVTPQTVREASREPVASAPRTFAYIETIPRGSNQRIREPVTPEYDIRRRTVDAADGYRGQWSPSSTISALKTNSESAPSQKTSSSRIYILGVLLLILVALLGYVYSQWNVEDRYDRIEAEAQQVAKDEQ